ncbi:unnamed protein product [Rotaria sordida]|uniref:SWIM-type domain-containing protein n=1 Tax=Rotaria sordida TaxID=392033 RepID=A0A813U643_9BILA|nr:unnamed protein product [Rotaria sordida]CAF0832823.1 unnamed protein product [Rotaria sordida]
MSKSNWILLCVVNSIDDATAVAKSLNVCQYRTNNLKDHTKYSFICSQYRKNSSCNYELKTVVPDDDPNSITVMFKNTHNHSNRSQTSRLPSPLRQSVSKYVRAGLTEPQICSSLAIDHPTIPVSSSKLTSLVQTERRKDRPEIFSVYDFRKWCNDYLDGTVPYSTFVPFYFINDVNDLFVLFTTKHLIQQIQSTPLLQIDATYKITWNELPLLVFGASDGNRHFHPFGVALVSDDESSSCYEHLFQSLQQLSIQELQKPYSPGFIMADGVLGINLLMTEWRSDPSLNKFRDYFYEQWIEKLSNWYEGYAFNIPSTNNGLWQRSCWLVVPLQSCSCPIGIKEYSCKHSVGLAIIFNTHQVSDKTRIQPLGKRKTRRRLKKVSTALNL